MNNVTQAVGVNDPGRSFLLGGGVMGSRLREQDWSASSLGAPEAWPEALRTLVSVLLAAKQPMFVAWGRERTLLYNDAYAEILGAKHPEAFGRSFLDVWSEIRDDLTPIVDQAFAGEPVHMDDIALVLNRNGYREQAHFAFSYTPVRDQSGAVAGFFCACTETTNQVAAERARQEAEAALRQNEGRLRSVLDSIAEAFVLLDRDFRVIEINPEAMRLETRPREAILGLSHWEAWPGTEHSELGRLYKRAMAEGEPLDVEHRYVWPDGHEAWLNVRAYSTADGLALFYRDITERKRARKALEESEAFTRLLIDSTSEAFYAVDRRGATTLCNEAFLRMLGFTSREDVMGRKLHDVIHHSRPDGSRYPSEDCPIHHAALEGRPVLVSDEVFFRLDGTAFPVEYRAEPILRDGVLQGAICTFSDVTERRAAAAALLESEARLRTLAAEQTAILGQLAEGVIVTDPAGRINFVNEAAARIHGVARLDVEPEDYSETYHLLTMEGEPYPPHELPLARAVLAGETVTEARWRIRRPDGSDVYAVGSARPVHDGAGNRIGAVLTLRDDTQRHAAERELRENEARLRALTDNLPSGMVYQIATGRDGSERRFLYVSQSHEKLTGVPADAVLADPSIPYHLILPEHRPAMVEAEAEAIREGKPFDVQVPFRHADGEVRWSRIISAPRLQADGTLIWDGIQIDITDQKAAETLLRDLNETLEARVAERTEERDRAWRLSQDLLVVAEQDGTIAEINTAWSALLGWQPGELIGQSIASFTHPDDLEGTLAVFAGILEAPLSTPFEYRFRHRDGAYRWFAWTGAFEQGRVYANGRHVTAEKEREAELESAREALRQAQKMEAVGQLTGGIAHDFNNMLAVVIGSLDLLGCRTGADDPRSRRYIDAATDGARRAALLTQRLLAFSRQQPLRPEAIELNKLVAGMSALLRGSLGSDIRLETVLAAGVWRTHADPNQLENVLLNLAVNARDAMPDGGRLTIETQNAHIDARYAAAHVGVPTGQYVLIAVSDTGSGMAEDVIARAFDPFFTTKEVGKGTGLGLSQVYGFVKQSGGHVAIYSEPGEGTTVKVYLPRLVGSEEDAPTDKAASELPLGSVQEVILVVEDEPAVRQFSVDALAELGYRVLEADGAAAALRLLGAHSEIELLFTDVVMPDVNGRKLADEARRRRPDLKVLFTTGYTRNAVVQTECSMPELS